MTSAGRWRGFAELCAALIAISRIGQCGSAGAQCTGADDDACADDGGWATPPAAMDDTVLDAVAGGPCNIEAFDVGELTQEEFMKRFAHFEPVILRGVDNVGFRRASSRPTLTGQFGGSVVQLASGNTYSYSKVTTTLREYLDEHLAPQNSERKGNETYFLFGDLDRDEWRPLLSQYNLPPLSLPDHSSVLSFGVAGAGTGVPFHFHGPGFAEVIYGRKRWFLYPFDDRPAFDPDATTLDWFLNEYPKLARETMPLECVMRPGEVIYFPDKWWHATLNVDTCVFMSTFLSP